MLQGGVDTERGAVVADAAIDLVDAVPRLPGRPTVMPYVGIIYAGVGRRHEPGGGRRVRRARRAARGESVALRAVGADRVVVVAGDAGDRRAARVLADHGRRTDDRSRAAVVGIDVVER